MFNNGGLLGFCIYIVLFIKLNFWIIWKWIWCIDIGKIDGLFIEDFYYFLFDFFVKKYWNLFWSLLFFYYINFNWIIEILNFLMIIIYFVGLFVKDKIGKNKIKLYFFFFNIWYFKVWIINFKVIYIDGIY